METIEKLDGKQIVCRIPATAKQITKDTFPWGLVCDWENIESDSPFFKSINGVLFTADCKTLLRYPPKKKATRYIVPNSVTHIMDSAFSYCEFLEDITLPASVTKIEDATFCGCSSLNEVKLSEYTTEVGFMAFSSCESLKAINLPDTLTSIGEMAFSSCRSLKAIKIPTSIQYIGSETFDGCKNMESMECVSERYRTFDSVLFDIKDKRCMYYPRAKAGHKYVIPDGVSVIEASAFNACRNLEEIILPDSVTSIEKEAFSFCYIRSIKIPNQTKTIAPSAFHYCWELKQIECNSAYFKSIDGVLFTADCKTLVCYPEGKVCKHYAIPEGVLRISEGAFKSIVDTHWCGSCENITLPKSIIEINGKTFSSHCNLKWIECDNAHYKSINGVLYTSDCKTLVYYPRNRKGRKFTIPNTVIKIETGAFNNLCNLRIIIVPKGRMEEFIKMFPEDNEYELVEA